MDAISAHVETRLSRAVERMPAFPQSVQKILELSRNVDCVPRDLVGIIEMDPVITMKVLRVVNSAQLGLGAKITSVNKSIVYLGQNTIKNLALSIATSGMLPAGRAADFDGRRYLAHSLITAAFARQLCSVYAPGDADPGDCYSAGLLHDFGQIALAQYLPEQVTQFPADGAERQLMRGRFETETPGSDHAAIGAMLARQWQLPDALVDCIGTHHAADAPTTGINDCLRMADLISHRLGDKQGGIRYRKGEAPINPKRFGVDLGKVIVALGDVDQLIAEAMRFVGASEFAVGASLLAMTGGNPLAGWA